jgi:MraZ protein
LSFRGSFDYSLDAKNRLTVPAAFRPTFADGLVLALETGAPSCVGIWTPEAYDDYVAQSLQGMHKLAPKRKELLRFFSANAFGAELDGAGRIMMPPRLVEKTGISREVTVNGAVDHVEVWSREAWTAYDADLGAKVANLTETFVSDAAS